MYSKAYYPTKKSTISLDSFSTIDNLWEDFSDWSKKDSDLFRLRTIHKIFKQMWDGIRAPKEMGVDETIITHLRDSFPNVEACRVRRPLGDFKDLMGLSHEDIFEELADECRQLRRSPSGLKSYLEQITDHCEWLWEEYFQQVWEEYSQQENSRYSFSWKRSYAEVGLALMLYGSSIGIYLEGRTHAALASWLERFPKAAEIFTYEPAPASMERDDVDGIFRHRASGEVAVAVSIKCLGALDRSFIEDIYRGKKGKTKPDIYIGYKSLDAELSAVEIGGSLKELLRRAI